MVLYEPSICKVLKGSTVASLNMSSFLAVFYISSMVRMHVAYIGFDEQVLISFYPRQCIVQQLVLIYLYNISDAKIVILTIFLTRYHFDHI